MKFKQPSKPFTPPLISSFFKEKYWTINEAVHVLVGWPKDDLSSISMSLLPDGIPLQRLFHVPCPKSPFDPKSLGKQFSNLFLKIKKSIEKGHLDAIFGYSNDGCSGLITPLITPEAFILWALRNGLLISQDLQREAHVYQIEDQKMTDSMRAKVQMKIRAQFILAKQPDANVTDLIKQLGVQDNTTNRRTISQLFATPGKSGRPRKYADSPEKRIYIPMAIPEIMQRALDGIVSYNFTYLKSAIEAATRAIIGAELPEKTFEGVFLEFLQDSVVKLYLPEPSDLLVKFVRKIHHDVIGEYFPYKPVLEGIERLYALGIQIDWPIKHGDFELRPMIGKICHF